MNIKQAEELSGVSRQNIRFYEREGLLYPDRNPENGYREYGEEHMRPGDLIVYTSADSVFQIACHESVYAPEELYRLCEVAREILQGKHGVARVIARPFVGENENYTRTSNRRDFSLKPSENNLLCYLKSLEKDVIAIGKIEDIFAGVGITEAVHTKDNQDGIDKTIEFMKKDYDGIICFPFQAPKEYGKPYRVPGMQRWSDKESIHCCA